MKKKFFISVFVIIALVIGFKKIKHIKTAGKTTETSLALEVSPGPNIDLTTLKHSFFPDEPNFKVFSRTELQTLLLPLHIGKYSLGATGLFPNDEKNMPNSKVDGSRGGYLCSTRENLYIFDRFGNVLRWNKKLKKTNLIDRTVKLVSGFTNNPVGLNSVICRDSRYGEEIYLSYFEKVDPEKKKFNSLIFKVFNLDNSNISLKKVATIESETWNQAGRLSFYKDNYILMSHTAFETAPINQVVQKNGLFRAMDPALASGKILIIDVNNGSWKTFSMGHRNQLGLYYTDGIIYETENGPMGGDELNIIEKGINYGWPIESHGTEYTMYTLVEASAPGRHDKYTKPVFSWVPAIAVSQLLKVKGFHSTWKGDLILSSLKAMSVFRVRVDKNKAEFVEQIYLGHRVRDIIEDEDLGILLTTDDRMLIHLTTPAVTPKERAYVNVRAPALVANCLNCHHLGPTSPMSSAPSLSNIFSRNIATDNFEYSDALKRKKNEKWTPEKLAQFLSDPQGFAPGTKMAFQLQDQDEMKTIIKLLKDMSTAIY